MIDSASSELLPLLQTTASPERLLARISEAIRVSLIAVLMSPVLVVVVTIAVLAALIMGVPLHASSTFAPARKLRIRPRHSDIPTIDI
jgi:hypothetical protein